MDERSSVRQREEQVKGTLSSSELAVTMKENRAM